MFEENLYVHDGKDSHYMGLRLGLSGPLHKVFQFWAAETARDALRLGVYFHAAGVFLQIPGAATFRRIHDDDFEEEHGIDYDGLVGDSPRNTLLDVLAKCLDRFNAGFLMGQVTTEPHVAGVLPNEWAVVLERRATIENGLLSVVADCLDALIVTPGMEEIVKADEPHWWNRLRVKMGPFGKQD